MGWAFPLHMGGVDRPPGVPSRDVPHRHRRGDPPGPGGRRGGQRAAEPARAPAPGRWWASPDWWLRTTASAAVGRAGRGAPDRGRAAGGLAGRPGPRDALGPGAEGGGRRSARAITARWVLAEGTRAITEASITHRPSVPRTRPAASTTASGSSGRPIRQRADRVVEGLDRAQHLVGVVEAGPGREDIGEGRRAGHLHQAPPRRDRRRPVGGLEEPAHLDRGWRRVAALEADDPAPRAGVGDLDVQVGVALAALDRARVGHHLVDAPLAGHLVGAGQQALVPGARPGGASRASSKR